MQLTAVLALCPLQLLQLELVGLFVVGVVGFDVLRLPFHCAGGCDAGQAQLCLDAHRQLQVEGGFEGLRGALIPQGQGVQGQLGHMQLR